MSAITVRHNFETGHRLPFLGGKCENLHGHSWWAEVTVTGQPDVDGVLIDFATIKRGLRDWIDSRLDHGCMLGAADSLLPALQAEGSKVFVFDPAAGGLTAGFVGPGPAFERPLPWPTVENVAELLRRVAVRLLGDDAHRFIVSVAVTETHVNAASAP